MRLGRTRRRNSDSVALERERRTDGASPPELQPPATNWSLPQPGRCIKLICGEEAACSNIGNTLTHKCICPHDGSTPTAELKCPRLTVPFAPSPIHNIIPPRGGINSSAIHINTTTETTNRPNPVDDNIDLMTIAVPTSVLAIFLLFIFCICCWKRKSIKGFFCRDKNSRKSEAPRTGEPLLADRYIANPHYSSAYNVPTNPKGPEVPLLQKNHLSFIDEIGEGCFGKVYKGILKVENGPSSMVAIKMLKDSASRTAEEDFMREVNIMSVFKHDNILTLIGILAAEDNSNPSMVFEYMPYGDLVGVLRSSSPTIRQPIEGLPMLDSQNLLYIALQIARGMEYLAAQRFVHRDLACRNCLVGDDLVVKIADFGMSRDVYTSDYYRMAGNRPMPIRWMSPESILYQIFTLESDVWSYGVVLWEIYSLGKQPYYGHNNDGARKLILQGIMLIPPENCPAFVCELMRACWRSDSKDRIDFERTCAKLQSVYDSGGWEESGGSEGSNERVNDNESWIMSYDINHKQSIESIPQMTTAIEMEQQSQTTDSQGYLVPLPPAFREYITALPD